MSEEESVTTWLAHLKTGRTDAAQEIWQRYVERLVRLARRKLGRTPRRAADEEDVVLSAFEGFLKGVEEGRFLRLDDRDDLWQVLVMLTERRAIALRRRELAIKRGGGEVRGESVFARHEGNGSHLPGLDQKSDREASPAFAAEMTEQLRFLLDQLTDQTQRDIALGKLHGKTNKELARDLGISLRAVERKLSMIRDKWRGNWGNE
jgi:RNA polymerase sigma factor (sigma-70 family)